MGLSSANLRLHGRPTFKLSRQLVTVTPHCYASIRPDINESLILTRKIINKRWHGSYRLFDTLLMGQLFWLRRVRGRVGHFHSFVRQRMMRQRSTWLTLECHLICSNDSFPPFLAFQARVHTLLLIVKPIISLVSFIKSDLSFFFVFLVRKPFFLEGIKKCHINSRKKCIHFLCGLFILMFLFAFLFTFA